MYLSTFLDPVLDYLADCLPPPIYSLLVGLASHSLEYLSSLFVSIASLPSSNLFNSNPQDIIPLLISVLCAYLALLTLYRTTTWAIRTAVWFFKWGLILSVIFTGLGWCLRGADSDWGDVANIGDTIIRTVHTVGGMNAHSEETNRPRPWDSYESHQHWRERSQQDAADGVQTTVIEVAGEILDQGGQWWAAAKSFVGGVQHGKRVPGEGKWQNNRRTKSRSR